MANYSVYGDVEQILSEGGDPNLYEVDDLVGHAYGHTVGDAYGHSVGDAYGHSVGDAYGHTVGAEAVHEATKKILAHAQRERATPPAMDVMPLEHDAEYHDPVGSALAYQWYDILGSEQLVYGDENSDPVEAGAPSTEPTSTDHFPMLRKLYGYFSSKIPAPKLVRLDTEESYKDFVSKKDFTALSNRVGELRNFVEQHVSDAHGAQANPLSVWSEILGDDALSEHAVPLSLPPSTRDKIKCWREGDRICTSMALPGHDGRARIATASTELSDAIEELVGYVEVSGVDPVEVLGALPDLACVLGGGALVPQIAQAAPALLADPASKGDKPVIRKLVPENYAGKAALMALCQNAQQGDEQAICEWQSLAEISNAPECDMLGEHMLDAANRLQIAQALKS